MSLLTRATGRAYFALQALAGAVWWVLVPTVDAVRVATLGPLDPLLVGLLDVPLFVLASALAALGMRWAVWIAAPWTVLVTAGMVVLATLTGEAGWGAVAMVAASAGSVLAAMLVLRGRVSLQRFLVGPLAFRPARGVSAERPLPATIAQLLVFWTLFLVVIPLPVVWLERRWGVSATLPEPLGAVAGIGQGIAVGLLGQSWLVIAYALAGAVLWHLLVRPEEEGDLAARFGADYARYRAQVRCWVPRLR